MVQHTHIVVLRRTRWLAKLESDGFAGGIRMSMWRVGVYVLAHTATHGPRQCHLLIADFITAILHRGCMTESLPHLVLSSFCQFWRSLGWFLVTSWNRCVAISGAIELNHDLNLWHLARLLPDQRSLPMCLVPMSWLA